MQNRPKSANLLCLTLFCVLALTSGCSSFNRDWKAAARQPAPTNEITGAWDGGWLSDRNGHRGRLRCILSRKSDAEFSARFKARFWKVFTAGYTVPLHVQGVTNGVFRLEGDNNLGKMAGGIYHYQADVTAVRFHSSYSNKYDYGAFELSRPVLK